MNKQAERVEALLKARGLKDREIRRALAEACGISYQSVRDWFTGETKSIDAANLGRIAKKWAGDLAWLVDGSGQMDAVESREPTAAYSLESVSVWDDDTPLEDDEVEVPFYKEVEFAAGSGQAYGLEINGRRVRYGRASLRAAGIDPATAACAKNNGNSMEPLIQDGSLIGIDRAKTQVVDGEIYALDHDGMLRVKYVYRLPGGGLRLRSFNSDEHPDENYSAEEAKSIKILGWVWTWSPPIRKWKGR